MDLQQYLVEKFKSWQPPAPRVLQRGKGDITLDWQLELDQPFGFLGDQLLYRLEKNNKLPKWTVVYSGGKSTKLIDNLAARYPHKFRLKVIVKASLVPLLADLALLYYGDEANVRDVFQQHNDNEDQPEPEGSDEGDADDDNCGEVSNDADDGRGDTEAAASSKTRKMRDLRKVCDAVKVLNALRRNVGGGGGGRDNSNREAEAPRWLESSWSAETWSSTESDGASATCFCMAVRCGYLNQIQSMLDERPELIGVASPSSGLTPLATAVRKGDMTTVRLLLGAGAELDQASCAGQTPLHVAVLAGRVDIVELLLEKGARLQARDWNGLRAEHYAVDSGSLETLQHVLQRGDVHVRDNNGWTPLFRALCQGASTSIVQELVARGSDIHAVDNAGLPLISVAKLLKNHHGRGRGRDSVLRLVDAHYPHEKALANFTRLTTKIHHVHSLFKSDY